MSTVAPKLYCEIPKNLVSEGITHDHERQICLPKPSRRVAPANANKDEYLPPDVIDITAPFIIGTSGINLGSLTFGALFTAFFSKPLTYIREAFFPGLLERIDPIRFSNRISPGWTDRAKILDEKNPKSLGETVDIIFNAQGGGKSNNGHEIARAAVKDALLYAQVQARKKLLEIVPWPRRLIYYGNPWSRSMAEIADVYLNLSLTRDEVLYIINRYNIAPEELKLMIEETTIYKSFRTMARRVLEEAEVTETRTGELPPEMLKYADQAARSNRALTVLGTEQASTDSLANVLEGVVKSLKTADVVPSGQIEVMVGPYKIRFDWVGVEYLKQLETIALKLKGGRPLTAAEEKIIDKMKEKNQPIRNLVDAATKHLGDRNESLENAERLLAWAKIDSNMGRGLRRALFVLQHINGGNPVLLKLPGGRRYHIVWGTPGSGKGAGFSASSPSKSYRGPYSFRATHAMALNETGSVVLEKALIIVDIDGKLSINSESDIARIGLLEKRIQKHPKVLRPFQKTYYDLLSAFKAIFPGEEMPQDIPPETMRILLLRAESIRGSTKLIDSLRQLNWIDREFGDLLRLASQGKVDPKTKKLLIESLKGQIAAIRERYSRCFGRDSARYMELLEEFEASVIKNRKDIQLQAWDKIASLTVARIGSSGGTLDSIRDPYLAENVSALAELANDSPGKATPERIMESLTRRIKARVHRVHKLPKKTGEQTGITSLPRFEPIKAIMNLLKEGDFTTVKNWLAKLALKMRSGGTFSESEWATIKYLRFYAGLLPHDIRTNLAEVSRMPIAPAVEAVEAKGVEEFAVVEEIAALERVEKPARRVAAMSKGILSEEAAPREFAPRSYEAMTCRVEEKPWSEEKFISTDRESAVEETIPLRPREDSQVVSIGQPVKKTAGTTEIEITPEVYAEARALGIAPERVPQLVAKAMEIETRGEMARLVRAKFNIEHLTKWLVDGKGRRWLEENRSQLIDSFKNRMKLGGPGLLLGITGLIGGQELADIIELDPVYNQEERFMMVIGSGHLANTGGTKVLEVASNRIRKMPFDFIKQEIVKEGGKEVIKLTYETRNSIAQAFASALARNFDLSGTVLDIAQRGTIGVIKFPINMALNMGPGILTSKLVDATLGRLLEQGSLTHSMLIGGAFFLPDIYKLALGGAKTSFLNKIFGSGLIKRLSKAAGWSFAMDLALLGASRLYHGDASTYERWVNKRATEKKFEAEGAYRFDPSDLFVIPLVTKAFNHFANFMAPDFTAWAHSHDGLMSKSKYWHEIREEDKKTSQGLQKVASDAMRQIMLFGEGTEGYSKKFYTELDFSAFRRPADAQLPSLIAEPENNTGSAAPTLRSSPDSCRNESGSVTHAPTLAPVHTSATDEPSSEETEQSEQKITLQKIISNLYFINQPVNNIYRELFNKDGALKGGMETALISTLFPTSVPTDPAQMLLDLRKIGLWTRYLNTSDPKERAKLDRIANDIGLFVQDTQVVKN